ncbi:MAG: envelope stress response membrane protein PspC [Zymomonas mobilis subsp. pomaceae]|uniref:Phage shock protein C, PspC n=1 Tax=Zymomonas mobilis subsp. pomaceae (strain ATCC 29192 / DSM 22645 / JCM 10191 / CCUG 17912 / NBRC 13757 / NCIMB 11200 / NRRL B-4491 / Barker I) TaxID=579138 RepID=F8EU45_ZYMMT|nr:envelope stress response membrane protein PspC [Zymomonas mobilis]AEI37125.1 phage shock protein C, PspC [Zymomonas mobilis subsp. pomaceae ATCC 29192]MDX5948496.1 envelope stress response membrane protein PspC [Zymomonas mobilis subsp. pomaceae]GEB89439.1 phage shock protein C [Zymomonas mobilis subsp. pomaceae]
MSFRRTKFYRDKYHGKILGVCAGIADYTGLDVTVVRILTVVATLIGGFPWTVIAYFVTAWLSENKPFELSEMDGDETRFWQGVRTKPRVSLRSVKGRFRDMNHRLAKVETYITSQDRRLAKEIDNLR